MEIKYKEFLKMVSDESGFQEGIVKLVMASMEKILMENLMKSATEGSVLIKMFKGLYVKAEYVPKRILTSGMYKGKECCEKIRAKAYLTDWYKDKLNTQLLEMLEDDKIAED